MRRSIAVLLFLFVASLGYAQDKGFENVEFIQQPSTGVLRLHATGYGKNVKACLEDAQKTAFKVILFRGISGSAASTPLIAGDITGANTDPKTASFFQDAVYKKFIPRIVQYSALQKTKLGKKVVVDMDVDYQSLRTYFEQIGVIRKFGY